MKKPSKTITLSAIFPLLNASEDVEGVFSCTSKQVGVDISKIEIIVVDDGSSDETPELIKKYGKLFKGFGDFRVIQHDSRMGLAKTRFDGAMLAQGKYITFIDKRTRLDPDYFVNLLNKKRDVVIGNIYMDKNASIWDRVLACVRKKLYYPYFNNPFDDIDLDYEAYRKFKNKGGGGVMLVKKDYYLAIAQNMSLGKDVNDDSMLIESLAKMAPILKTSTAKAQYLNRTGTVENIRHLYNRGPKFVDYYSKPGTRFFPAITSLIVFLLIDLVLVFVAPSLLLWQFAGLVILVIFSALYITEEPKDFFSCLLVIPLALVSFVAGILKGLCMKVLRKY